MILARLIRQGMKIRYLCFGLGAIALQLDWLVRGDRTLLLPFIQFAQNFCHC